ncbi:hypothetical protein [Nocardioides sp. WS12]|uniref:hypothetical protein n=1 Tax=Nocardioides sp. WS12 TaxID=2486272 RepID=UPI0015FA0BB9|nr:hypothetical protein [Nocardioides sp. WS12]
MNASGKSARPLPRHLLSPQEIARSAVESRDADLTRHHGQGNGVQVHAAYFAAVSLVALVGLIIAVAVATRMM